MWSAYSSLNRRVETVCKGVLGQEIIYNRLHVTEILFQAIDTQMGSIFDTGLLSLNSSSFDRTFESLK